MHRQATSLAAAAALAALVFVPFTARAAGANPPGIAGRWQGTSICVRDAGNSACRDETVQYDFTPSPSDPGAFDLDAQKLVDGRYETMYTMTFRFDAAAKRWTSAFHTKRDDRDGVWSYAVDGDRLTGTCVLLPDSLVRNVKAVRVKAPAQH